MACIELTTMKWDTCGKQDRLQKFTGARRPGGVRYRELPIVGKAVHPTLNIRWQTVWSVSDVEQYETVMEGLATPSH